MRRLRFRPEINAGSMADIAFLLLIFFLVTATVSTDTGINRLLPRLCPTPPCTVDIPQRNILEVRINNNDQIMVESDVITLEELKDLAINFLDNNGDKSCNYCHGDKITTSSDNPKKAVISLVSGKQTSYKQFIAVQNELSKAYYELRSMYAINVFNKPTDKLTKQELKEVKEAYPFILSDAETN